MIRMKSRGSETVFIFLGALLSFCFGIGLAYARNPGMLYQRNSYDLSWEMFVSFCGKWYIVMGLIGIPMLLITLIVSLVRGKKESDKPS